MKNYLLTYSDNWADEIDIDGFCIIDDKILDLFLKKIKTFRKKSFYIGTNEEIEYTKSNIEDVFNYKEISNEDLETLKQLGLLNYGFASSFVEFITGVEFTFGKEICSLNDD